jgi:hypothetical protein
LVLSLVLLEEFLLVDAIGKVSHVSRDSGIIANNI